MCRTWSETPKTGFLITRFILETMYKAAVSCIALLVIIVDCNGNGYSDGNDQFEIADDESVLGPTGKKYFKTGNYSSLYYK